MSNNHLYSTTEDRINTVASRNSFWLLLREIKEEWGLLMDSLDTELDFDDYVRVTYGIKLQYDPDGNITGSFETVDESLYTFALLKFKK